jgi:hypothetical protein
MESPANFEQKETRQKGKLGGLVRPGARQAAGGARDQHAPLLQLRGVKLSIVVGTAAALLLLSNT